MAPHDNPKMQPKQQRKKRTRPSARTGKPRNNAVPQPKSRAPRKKSSRSTARGSGANQQALAQYARMIHDPFKAPLVPGMFGRPSTGINRFHLTYGWGDGGADTATGACTAGFVLWFPQYLSKGWSSTISPTKAQPENLFFWKTNSASDIIPNTTANPFGRGTIGSAFASVPVCSATTPDYSFLTGVADRAALVGAGIQLRNLETIFKMTGEYVKLENIDADTLLSSSTSIDDLFAASNHLPQPFTQGKCSKHVFLNERHLVGRLHDASLNSNSSLDEAVEGPGGALALPGNPVTTPTELTAEGNVLRPKCFGYAWRGVTPTSVSKIFVDLDVVKEWNIQHEKGIPVPDGNRSGPDVGEPSHLLATVKKVANDALEIGETALGGVASKALTKAIPALIAMV